MSKFLTSSAIFMFLLILLGGIFMPSATFMWLASTDIFFTILRTVVIAMLAVLLLTSPPRSHVFRIIAGILALVLFGTVFSQLNYNTLLLLDALAFIQASIILGIAAIEPSEEPKKYSIFATK